MANLHVEQFIKTALVITDNPGMRNDLAAKLAGFEIETLKTASGADGYSQIALLRVRCDLIVIDLKMGGITPEQFLATLRKNSRFARSIVVVICDKGEVKRVEKLLTYKLCSVLFRPFSVDYLISQVENLLEIYTKFDFNIEILPPLAEARIYEEQKDYYEALRSYHKILSHGTCGRVQFELGKCYRFADLHASAHQAINTALKQAPELAREINSFLKSYPIDKNKAEGKARPTEIAKKALEKFAIPKNELAPPLYGTGQIRAAVIALQGVEKQKMVTEALSSFAIHQIFSVSSIKEALKKVSTTFIDLVIIDQQLADGDILSFMTQLASIEKSEWMQVITVVSGNTKPAELETFFAAGIDAIIPAPLTAVDIKYGIESGICFADMTALSFGPEKHLKLSWHHLFRNEIAPASAIIEKLIAEDHCDGLLHLTRGIILARKLQHDEALREYDIALAFNKNFALVIARQEAIYQTLIREKEKTLAQQQRAKETKEREEEIRKQKKGERAEDERLRQEKERLETERLNAKRGPGVVFSAPLEELEGEDNAMNLAATVIAPPSYEIEFEKVPLTDESALEENAMPLEKVITANSSPYQVEFSPDEDEEILEDLSDEGQPKNLHQPSSNYRLLLDLNSAGEEPTVENERRKDEDIILEAPVQPINFDDGFEFEDDMTPAYHHQKITFEKIENANTQPKELVFNFSPLIPDEDTRENPLKSASITWMTPIDLQKIPLPEKNAVENSAPRYTALNAYERSAKQLTEQAKLFQGRIMASGFTDNQMPEMNQYITALGQEVVNLSHKMRFDFAEVAAQNKINSLVKEVQKEDHSAKKLHELGQAFFTTGMADGFLNQLLHLKGAENSKGAICQSAAYGIKNISPESGRLSQFFEQHRNDLLKTSLHGDGGSTIMQSFLEGLGVNPLLNMLDGPTNCASFFSDLRNSHLLELLGNSLQKNPTVLKMLAEKLPSDIDLSMLMMGGSSKQASMLLDLIETHGARSTFVEILQKTGIGELIITEMAQNGGCANFIDTLVKLPSEGIKAALEDNTFNLGMLERLVLKGEGLSIFQNLLQKGGVKVIDDIVRSGGGVRMISDVVTSPFADLLLERLTREQNLRGFIAKAMKSEEAQKILASHLKDKKSSLEDEIEKNWGEDLIAAIRSEGMSGRLISAVLHGDAADELVRDTFAREELRDVVFKALTHEQNHLSQSTEEREALMESIFNLSDPITKLHEKLWDDKEKSAAEIDEYFAQHTNESDPDEFVDKLNQCLHDDHNSLQCFKKCYKKLIDQKLYDEAERYFDENHEKFTAHDEMRESLYSFISDLRVKKEKESIDSNDPKKKKLLEKSARDILAKGLELRNNDYFYLKELAASALKDNNHEEVFKLVSRMIKVNPKSGEAFNILGVSYKRQGRFKRAIKEYERGIKIDPRNSKLYNNIAICQAQIGDEKNAKINYQKARIFKNGGGSSSSAA